MLLEFRCNDCVGNLLSIPASFGTTTTLSCFHTGIGTRPSISGKAIGETLGDASSLPKPPVDAADRPAGWSGYARMLMETFPFHLFGTAQVEEKESNKEYKT
jgi:hypothetical protein